MISFVFHIFLVKSTWIRKNFGSLLDVGGCVAGALLFVGRLPASSLAAAAVVIVGRVGHGRLRTTARSRLCWVMFRLDLARLGSEKIANVLKKEQQGKLISVISSSPNSKWSKSQITCVSILYIITIFAYWYNSVNVISLGQAQRDHIKWRLL